MLKRENLLKKAFQTKLNQTLSLLNNNLLLLDIRGDYNNPHIQSFLLDGTRTRPVAILIDKSGKSSILIHEMESNGVLPLNDITDIATYITMKDFYGYIVNFFGEGSEVLAEISDNTTKFEMLLPSTIEKLSENLSLLSADDILFDLRSIKTDTEISLIRKAIKITNEILDKLEEWIEVGISEIDIYKNLSHMVVDEGLKYSFEPIIASGKRSSSPHPINYTNRVLEKGDHLLIDCGVQCEGYCSDITRTYILNGEIKDSDFFRYNSLLVDALKKEPILGLTQSQLAERFRTIAENEEFTEYEKHSYGHGLGVVVHDLFPLISTQSVSFIDKVIENNMVFTFEPGFYGDFGGFRIENDYYVDDGYAKMIV